VDADRVSMGIIGGEMWWTNPSKTLGYAPVWIPTYVERKFAHALKTSILY
jgi:hypothetical protein